MTCKHGFIGACAECDGSGQMPNDIEAWAQDEMNKPEARAFYLSQIPGEHDMAGPKVCPVCEDSACEVKSRACGK